MDAWDPNRQGALLEMHHNTYLILMGMTDEGLDIVRVCRDRYDGAIRNPFNEYECGHWYARAMASYALIQACSGVRFDRVSSTLYIGRKDRDFRCFFSAEGGYGFAGIRNGEPYCEPVKGTLPIAAVKAE